MGQSGPLAKYITPDIYVSAVNENCLSYADGEAVTEKKEPEEERDGSREMKQEQAAERPGLITRLGIGVGQVVGKFFAAGRETIEMVVKNILPFMAFTRHYPFNITAMDLVSLSKTFRVVCTLPGMLIISLIRAMPFLSPVSVPEPLSHRSWELFRDHRSLWARYRLNMHCRHFLRSMPR